MLEPTRFGNLKISFRSARLPIILAFKLKRDLQFKRKIVKVEKSQWRRNFHESTNFYYVRQFAIKSPVDRCVWLSYC